MKASEEGAGLRILIQCSSTTHVKTIVKPTLRLMMIKPPATSSKYEESSFLKTCHLCKKRLSLEMDVYMYRGDQGFCSIECRCRQIFIDEMKEMEALTKEMLASSKHCRASRQVKSGRPRTIRPAII